jgi:hypothetical protein
MELCLCGVAAQEIGSTGGPNRTPSACPLLPKTSGTRHQTPLALCPAKRRGLVTEVPHADVLEYFLAKTFEYFHQQVPTARLN